MKNAEIELRDKLINVQRQLKKEKEAVMIFPEGRTPRVPSG
jgi:hypothetical protein